MSPINETISTLANIDAAQSLSEAERLQLSDALLSALRRVQSPWDIACAHGWIEVTTTAAIKTLIDTGLFTRWAELDGKPTTTAQFGELTGADPALLARLLRHLAAQHFITETGEDTYASTPWSLALGRDAALASIYGTFYHEVNAPLGVSLPAFLKKTDFKNPTDVAASNFQHLFGEGSTYFGFISSSPDRNKDFANAMECHARGNVLPWTEVYDTTELLAGAKLDRPLVVDVGGSKGHDLERFLEKHADIPKGSLVLQDLPEILTNLTIDPAITICPHDFFTPQPVKYAAAYLLHLILHDWPDEKAVHILRGIADAMEPGYSKLLLYEDVVATRDPSVQATVADMTMMMCFSSKERTEKEWRDIVGRVDGLRIVKVWRKPQSLGGIIEVERID